MDAANAISTPSATNLSGQPVTQQILPVLQPRASPPPYEEAIVLPLNDTLTGSLLNPPATGAAVTAKDFLLEEEYEAHDFEEDEREYEASRPLKMGKIPDARAQYTFIQPTDTIHSKAPVRQHSPGSGSCNVLPSAPPLGGVDSSLYPTYLPPSGLPPPSEYGQDNNPPLSYGSSSSTTGSSSNASAPPPLAPPTLSTPYHATQVPFAGVPETPGLINAQDISIADFKRTTNGIESHDKVLADPYQLYRFFVAHNDRPTMHVVIKGIFSHTPLPSMIVIVYFDIWSNHIL
jgi:hypothetical protein